MKIQSSANTFRKHLPKDQTQQRIANLQSHAGAPHQPPLSGSGRVATSPSLPSWFLCGCCVSHLGAQSYTATHGVENQAKGMLSVNLWCWSPGVPAVELPFLLSLMKMERKKKIAHWLFFKIQTSCSLVLSLCLIFTVFTPTKHTPGPPAPSLKCQWHEYLCFLWNRPQILLFHLGSETLKSWVYQWEFIAGASSPPAMGCWSCPALAAGSQTCSHIKGLWKLQVLNWKGHKDLQANFACN